MKMRFIIFSVLLCCAMIEEVQAQTQGEEIELSSKNSETVSNQYEIPIPVHINYDYEQLNIHITENIENVSTTIEGPEGIVYQQQITAPKGQSLSVNLQPFQEGEYTIIFQDAEGNEVEGYFTKEKEEIFN